MRFKSVVCATLLLGIAVQASQEKSPGKGKDEPGIQRGGVIVVIDPVTRQVREATPAEIGMISAPATVQAAAPAIIQGPGGAVGVILGPEHQVHAVAAKTTGGKVRVAEVAGSAIASTTIFSGVSSGPAHGK